MKVLWAFALLLLITPSKCSEDKSGSLEEQKESNLNLDSQIENGSVVSESNQAWEDSSENQIVLLVNEDHENPRAQREANPAELDTYAVVPTADLHVEHRGLPDESLELPVASLKHGPPKFQVHLPSVRHKQETFFHPEPFISPLYYPPHSRYAPPDSDYGVPLLPTVYGQPEHHVMALGLQYSEPQEEYGLPKPGYHAPKPTYRPPSPYKAPPIEYGAPQRGYEIPASTYNDPREEFNAPTYDIPKSVYEIPKPGYHAPKPTYAPPKAYEDSDKGYRIPKPAYVPPSVYNTPNLAYHAPQPTYAPPKKYKAPSTGYSYDEPKDTYSIPKSDYGVLASGYKPPKTHKNGYKIHDPAYSTTSLPFFVPKTGGQYSESVTFLPPYDWNDYEESWIKKSKDGYDSPKTEYKPPEQEYGAPLSTEYNYPNEQRYYLRYKPKKAQSALQYEAPPSDEYLVPKANVLPAPDYKLPPSYEVPKNAYTIIQKGVGPAPVYGPPTLPHRVLNPYVPAVGHPFLPRRRRLGFHRRRPPGFRRRYRERFFIEK